MTRYFVFTATSLALLLVSISGTSVSVAFPNITAEFGVSLILAGWVLNVSQLAGTVIMPLAGKAGDIFGGKRTFLISIAVFTTGSLLSAIAPNIWFLIFARFIQSVGAGAFLPLATSIISEYFPESRQQAIGLFSSIFPIGMIIGPNIGGWLVASFGWQSIFWFNLPLGVSVFVFALIIIKSGKIEAGKLDLTGAGLFTGMLSGFLVAISIIGSSRNSLSLSLFTILIILTVALFYLFMRHERRVKNPVIDLEVLQTRPFQAANYFNIIYGAAVLGVMSFIPLYATTVLGMSTLASGLILTPRSVGQMLSSFITSLSLPKWGYRRPMIIGTGLAILSLVLLGSRISSLEIFGTRISGAVLLGIFMFITGIGSGAVAPAANNACIELMPHRIATITGVRGMFRQSGSALSIAISAMVLDNFKDIGTGFRVVFFSLAAILLLSMPFILAMPRSAKDSCPVGEDRENSKR